MQKLTGSKTCQLFSIQQFQQLILRHFQNAPALARQDIQQLGLLVLQIQDALLDGVLGDELVDLDALPLADSVGTVRGLVLGRQIPPGVVVDDGFGSGQI